MEAAILTEIEKIADNGVSKAELDKAKNRFVKSMIFARDSQSGMARIYGSTLATGGTVADVTEWPDRIRKVPAEAVQAAARKYLDRRVSVTGYLLPAEQERG